MSTARTDLTPVERADEALDHGRIYEFDALLTADVDDARAGRGGAACTANWAFAATESTISSDRGLYHSANAGPSYSAEVSTLTNDVGQTRGSAERQLPLGIGLLAVGLLGLVCGLAAIVLTRRRTRRGPRR